MQWKLPTRVLETRQGTIKPSDTALGQTKERFYEDYVGGSGMSCARQLVNTIISAVTLSSFSCARLEQLILSTYNRTQTKKSILADTRRSSCHYFERFLSVCPSD